jgi:hypothetical protein
MIAANGDAGDGEGNGDDVHLSSPIDASESDVAPRLRNRENGVLLGVFGLVALEGPGDGDGSPRMSRVALSTNRASAISCVIVICLWISSTAVALSLSE